MTVTIGLRELLAALGGAAVAWPLAARAQQPERMRRIGVLMGQAKDDPGNRPRVAVFEQTLGKLGWSKGRTVAIEFRWGAGNLDRMQSYAKELVGLAPDVVVAETTPAAAALHQESRGIPVVFIQVANPVGSGFVKSLAHPEGSMTGFTNFEPTMGSKWLELLKEVSPRLAHAAAIYNPETHSGQYWGAIEAAAASLAVKFTKAPAHDGNEIERAVAATASEPDGGLIVMPDAFTLSHRELIVTDAALHRLPSIYAFRVFPASGGLLSYGVDQVEIYRRAAAYVDRIIRGTKAGELPVEAPTKFELVVNLKTAKTLGLTVPDKLLVAADEVVE
jgi:putative tryptophan/tyrosine transport system substrate-binding protein